MINIFKNKEYINDTLQNMCQSLANLYNLTNGHNHAEKIYQRLFKSSPIGIFIIDMKGIIRFCIPATYREKGYTAKDFVGKHFTDIINKYGNDPTKYNEIYESFINGKSPQTLEFAAQRKDGSTVYTEVHASWLDEQDRNLGILVYTVDITKYKRVEENLRESEEIFSKIFRASPNAICIFTAEEGKFIDVNESFTRFTGYTREEVIGRSGIELGLWVNEGDVERAGEALTKDGRLYNGEFKSRTKSGEIRTGLFSLDTMDIQGSPCMICVITDVTEQKQAEEDLRDKEEKLSDLLDNTNELVQTITPDGHFKYVNNSWRQALGYSEKEISNLSIFDIIHPDYMEYGQMLLEKVISGKEVGWLEAAFISKSGSKITVEGKLTCKHNNGETTYIRGIFRDVTKNKYLEEQMFRLSSAISMSTDCIVITDSDAKIIDVNNKFLEIYGAESKDELIGKHFLELIVPAERAMVNSDVKEIIENGCLECREYHINPKHGRELPLHITTSLVKAADNSPMGIVRVCRQISVSN